MGSITSPHTISSGDQNVAGCSLSLNYCCSVWKRARFGGPEERGGRSQLPDTSACNPSSYRSTRGDEVLLPIHPQRSPPFSLSLF